MATGSSGTLWIVIYALKIVYCALDLTSGKIDDDFSFFYTSWANTLHIPISLHEQPESDI